MPTWETTARSFAGTVIRGPDDAAVVVREVFAEDRCNRHVVLALDHGHRLVGFGGRAPEQSGGPLVPSHRGRRMRERSGGFGV